jgi:hypothetical protein
MTATQGKHDVLKDIFEHDPYNLCAIEGNSDLVNINCSQVNFTRRGMNDPAFRDVSFWRREKELPAAGDTVQ